MGFKSAYPDFFLYSSHQWQDFEELRNVMEEDFEKLPLVDSEYKREFLKVEIKKIKQYLLKQYGQIGEDRTEEEVRNHQFRDNYRVTPCWSENLRSIFMRKYH